MKFTDPQRGTQIELTGTSACKLYITNGLTHLDGANKFLNAYVRSAPLDGGNPVNFTHELKMSEGYVLMQGDMIEIIQSICALDFISEQVQDQIIEAITSALITKARALVSVNYQPHFMATMAACLQAPPPRPFTPPL